MIRPDKLAAALALAIIAVAALFAAAPAFAQAVPAGAPLPPPTKADITRSSPCGAAGVGYAMTDKGVWVVQRREGVNSMRVNAQGRWMHGCAKPGHDACPAQTVAPWGAKGACAPARNAQGALPSLNPGDLWRVRTRAGAQPKGEALYECKAGAWALTSSVCNQ